MPESPIAAGTPQSQQIILAVEEEAFDWWTDVSVHSYMLDCADGFSFGVSIPSAQAAERMFPKTKGVPEKALAYIRPGSRCQILVRTSRALKPVVQMTGRIDDVEFHTTKEGGSMMKVTGRDHMGPVVDSSIIPTGTMSNVTLYDVILQTLAPLGFFGNKILINNDANRVLLTGKAAAGVTLSSEAPEGLDAIQLTDARPHAGETVFAYLDRHCRRFGLIFWGTADGKIVFGRPNYAQKPLYRLALRSGPGAVENNCLQGSRKLSFKNRPSEVHVYGKTHGHDFNSSPVHGKVVDQEVLDSGFIRPLTVHHASAKSNHEAERVARHEVAMRKQNGDVVSLSAIGYSAADGAVYATDTIADVQYDAARVDALLYVVARTFTRSMAGTSTQLTLLPKNAISLQ